MQQHPRSGNGWRAKLLAIAMFAQAFNAEYTIRVALYGWIEATFGLFALTIHVFLHFECICRRRIQDRQP